jgi:2-polyprenyl-6-methoxyphenol hydroxylase-like FAD-dependent oxidoreductase
MASEYDVVTIGGGLGGAALAMALASHGVRVLVLERERQFKDRVRGEYMSPWGVAETRELGIYELVRDNCGQDVPLVEMGFGPRDLVATTPQQLPALGFYHPEMQETVLAAASRAGAEVRRGVSVVDVKCGQSPSVVVKDGEQTNEIAARLVVAADGRNSSARGCAGFTAHEKVQPFLFAGVALQGPSSPKNSAYLLFNPELGMATAMTPTGNDRFRAYVAYETACDYRLQGDESLGKFIEESKKAGPVSAFYEDVKPIGPLASFRCGDFWTEHPYKDGVALIGDAASTSDPAFGQGLSLTVRDVRVLRDLLLSNSDWDKAGHDYAAEHDRYYEVAHNVDDWFRQIFLEQGEEANARRARALPKIVEDQTRVPDHLLSGPDLPADDKVRRRFFGEDV